MWLDIWFIIFAIGLLVFLTVLSMKLSNRKLWRATSLISDAGEPEVMKWVKPTHFINPWSWNSWKKQLFYVWKCGIPTGVSRKWMDQLTDELKKSRELLLIKIIVTDNATPATCNYACEQLIEQRDVTECLLLLVCWFWILMKRLCWRPCGSNGEFDNFM